MVDEVTFKSLKIKPALEKCNTKYFAYKAENPISILRQFVSRIERKGISALAGFIMIEGAAECLLSNKTTLSLRVITMDAEINMEVNQNDVEIK